jgi:hypothetical protein
LRNVQPEGINPTLHFWLNEFDQAKYDALPKYYKEKIAESSEWRGNKAKEAEIVTKRPIIDISDDVPF